MTPSEHNSHQSENTFNEAKYKWQGFRPHIYKAYWFCWKPKVIKGANSRTFMFLWWRLEVSWWWNLHVVWNDGWDAHFRQTMDKTIRDEQIIESTKVFNRKN